MWRHLSDNHSQIATEARANQAKKDPTRKMNSSQLQLIGDSESILKLNGGAYKLPISKQKKFDSALVEMIYLGIYIFLAHLLIH